MEQNVGQLERMMRGNCTQLKCVCCKRKDAIRACEKFRMERCTYAPDDRITQREEVEMVWACAEAR